MANRFADEIIGTFTGERGPFDSQIAFLSTRGGRFKDVYVMAADGEDVRRVTNENTLNLSPVVGSGRALAGPDVVSRRQPRSLLDRPHRRIVVTPVVAARPESRRPLVAGWPPDRGHARVRRQSRDRHPQSGRLARAPPHRSLGGRCLRHAGRPTASSWPSAPTVRARRRSTSWAPTAAACDA